MVPVPHTVTRQSMLRDRSTIEDGIRLVRSVASTPMERSNGALNWPGRVIPPPSSIPGAPSMFRMVGGGSALSRTRRRHPPHQERSIMQIKPLGPRMNTNEHEWSCSPGSHLPIVGHNHYFLFVSIRGSPPKCASGGEYDCCRDMYRCSRW